MDDIRPEDFTMMFANSIVFNKNKPIYVQAMLENNQVYYTDMLTNRSYLKHFKELKIKPPALRIGFVNTCGSVAYMQRIPVRKYKVGICRDNTRIQLLDGINFPIGSMSTNARITSFCVPEIADAMLNKYPSLSDAIVNVKQSNGACAFDHQFAVDHRYRIWYKTKIVGTVKATEDPPTVEDINWKAGFEHLIILLRDNHEA